MNRDTADYSGQTMEQLLRLGLQHHQAGRLAQAEAAYRQLLVMNPQHADALHLSGLIAHQRGQSEIAVALMGRAIEVNPLNPVYHSNRGLAYKAQGNLDQAINSFLKSLSIKQDIAEVHYNLAVAYLEQGRAGEAIESFRQALAIKPDYAEAYRKLGNALLGKGQLDEAIASYQRALAIRPGNIEALSNMGGAFHQQGQLGEAITCLRAAIASRPDLAEPHNNLGILLSMQGKLEEAIASFRQALSINPDYAEANNNLGNVFKEQNKPDEAIASFRQALSINPDYAAAYANLGNVLQDQYRLDEAIELYRKALAIIPDYAEACNYLGNALENQRQLGEAIEIYRKALAIRPDYAEAYSNLLFLHAYHGTLEPAAYLLLARGWEIACVPERDREFARKRKFQRPPLAGRRLRIGYVSGDFRQHAVSYFIEQLFSLHDHARVELYAYSTNALRDAVTDRLRALVEHWMPVAGLSDAAFLQRIEADKIDVLIDLSGHTGHNRMAVFARRAAPVQVHYLGYFASTGLSEMDYFIGDAMLTPPATNAHFIEQIWRLPGIRASYDGKADLPESNWNVAADGSVCVGSFNDLGKLTRKTFSLWAKVLQALPEARLLLKTKGLGDTGNRRRILDGMVAEGIPAERVELQSSEITPGWREHMAYYDRLDIALDPIGAHGGYTTTCDALWMGVPVVTLEGDRMASRMTASILSAIGHPEWIANSETDYVDKVAALARDVEHRKESRPAQRKRMADSPLGDAKGLVSKLENSYLEMFERWLQKQYT